MKNIFLPFFSRSIEHENCQQTKYKGLESLLTDIVQVMSVFLYDLRGCGKQNFLKKNQTFQ